MNKYLKLFIILLLNNYSSYSQNLHVLDSLIKQLDTAKEDTAKVNTLNSLAFEFRNNDPDTSIYFSNKALELSKKLKFECGIADAYVQLSNAITNLGEYDNAMKKANEALMIYKELLNTGTPVNKSLILKKESSAYNNIGNIYWWQANYPAALNNHLAALKIREEIADKNGIAVSNSNIGLVYSSQGNSLEALRYYYAGLKSLEELGKKESIAAVYLNISQIYRDQENYPEAIRCCFSSLKIYKELKDKRGIAICLNSIGAVYDDQGNYTEALKNYFPSLKIREELGDKQGIAQSYNNIGLIYSYQLNYAQALSNLFASLKMKEEIGDKNGTAEAYNNIGNIYRKQKNYKEASLYLYKGLMLAKEIGNMESIQYNYISLATLDSAQGNFKHSLEYYKLYISVRDSLKSDEITQKITEQKMQYDFDKKQAVAIAEQDRKDFIVQEEVHEQKIIRNSFIAGSILLLLLILVLINRNNLKRTVEIERMRSRLSRDLHDDIGSTLSSINILSRTAQNNLSPSQDEKTKIALEKINDRSQRLLDNMSDIIWNINPGNDTIEEVMSRMREYATTILEAKNIDYTFNFPKDKLDCKLSMEVKNNMYLIFKEAVNNLSKYSGCTHAYLSLTFDEKNILIKIEDNGIGFNENKIQHRGGLSNMKHRAEEIKGQIKINSAAEKGTCIELSMPRYC